MTQTLLVFTAADVQGRTLFRAARLELELRPGTGRVWLDVSREQGFTTVWQQHLQHLQRVGKQFFSAGPSPLPWEQTDLFVSTRGRHITLDGRSASLPLFLGWLSLLSGRALPEPFLATGVVMDGHALLPAPEAFIRGKLEVAALLAQQLRPHGPFPVPFWYPAGSEVQAGPFPRLALKPLGSLLEGATQILGLEPPQTDLTQEDLTP